MSAFQSSLPSFAGNGRRYSGVILISIAFKMVVHMLYWFLIAVTAFYGQKYLDAFVKRWSITFSLTFVGLFYQLTGKSD